MSSLRAVAALGLGFTAVASSSAAVAVAPNANAAALGNGQGVIPLRNYGAGGSRFQQVYGSSLFGTFGASEAITTLAFRAKQGAFGSFIGNSVTVSNIIITLSTTAKSDVTTLDGVFANNIGANVTTVYSGPLTLTATSPGSTNIDYVINLQSVFVYAKGLGNLLLDVTIPDSATVSGNGSLGFSQFDTVTDAFPSADGIGSVTGSSGSAVQGANSTTGVVTKFTTLVPTPGVASLLGLAGIAVARRRRVG